MIPSQSGKDLRKEVESHSSALTNIRISEIKKVVWMIGFQVMSSRPNPMLRLEFFAAILEYFLETKDIYDSDDLGKIETKVKEGNRISALLRVKQTANPKNMENLIQVCLALQYMINTALQKKGYFFRMGKRDPKGIDAALNMFKNDVWEDEDNAGTA